MHADRLRQPAHMYREIRATLRCRYAALDKALMRPELGVCCWHYCAEVCARDRAPPAPQAWRGPAQPGGQPRGGQRRWGGRACTEP